MYITIYSLYDFVYAIYVYLRISPHTISVNLRYITSLCRGYVQAVCLLVIDEIHLLGDERGPVLEVIVSRSNFIASHTEHKVRVVGLSTALANARDLADWLEIKQVC